MKGQNVFNKTGGNCWYCGQVLTKETFTVDHVIPINKGGSNHIDNKVPCCKPCNSKKRDRTLEHFREIMGRKNNWLHFSATQKAWLFMRYGIDIDLDTHTEPFIFYFEAAGLG